MTHPSPTLLHDFFECSFRLDGSALEASIELNAAHPIFEGHFPGQPIVPGVCMIHMLKEVLELALDRSLELQSASNIKFVAFIDPRLHPAIQLSCSWQQQADQLRVSAVLKGKETIFFKFKGDFH
ncbi:MAG: 3-hydroxyacyl-ACP dehydratase [Bacteroidetes bacterium]|nr:MAG: 3-hydroxyacyl-ACP dehydratase [Bacteroidota bacterium]